MKDSFGRQILATIIGVLAVGVITSVFSTLFLIMILIAGSGESQVKVLPSSVLRIDLSHPITERTSEEDINLSGLMPSIPFISINAPQSGIGILDAVKAVNAAAFDPNISYIAVTGFCGTTEIAELEELRAALTEFRKSGKPVIAWGESFSQADYYLASVADKVYLAPMSLSAMTGLSSTIMYLKDLLNMVGVNMQLIRHGKYKSAGEQFISNRMSEENEEQQTAMLKSVWKTMEKAICESRNISTAHFNSLVNNLELISTEDFLKHKLIDGALSRIEFEKEICVLSGKENISEVNVIWLKNYIAATNAKQKSAKDKVAILYADGEIYDGKGEDGIYSSNFVKIIREIREDDNIKAVVLRVNSPGGSATAAEQIRNELNLLAAEKPLIASYGCYAASGGYWISAEAQKIFSDRSCLTGSIGVFALIPSWEYTLRKVRVRPATVRTHDHADLMEPSRDLEQVEIEALQRSIEDTYSKFVSIVSNGRNMSRQRVDDLAQGRVWTGSEAKGIKLVDEIGGLSNALDYAVVAADLSNGYNVVSYPRLKTFSESLMEEFLGTASSVKAASDLISDPTQWALNLQRELGNQNRKTYALMPYIYL